MRAHDVIERYLLAGLRPPAPFIRPETRITTCGSCIAENISRYLDSREYRVLNLDFSSAYVVSVGEGLVNSFALRQQFDCALRDIAPKGDLWYGWNAESYGVDEKVRQTTQTLFRQTGVFILTLGLSEIWYDKPKGEVFWRAGPERVVDSARHKFRVSTVEENKQNLLSIYRAIREFCPQAKIVVTLSPIPLVAAFRPVSALTAKAVSKAVLRAAIDETLAVVGGEGVLHYWPFFEIVVEGFGCGRWWDDRGHIRPELIFCIMRLFEDACCTGGSTEGSGLQALSEGRTATGDLAAECLAAIDASDLSSVNAQVRDRLASDDQEGAEFVVRLALDAHPTSFAIQRLLDEVRSHPVSELLDRQLYVERMSQLLDRYMRYECPFSARTSMMPSGCCINGLMRTGFESSPMR